MSFLKSLFGLKAREKLGRSYDESGLSKIYEEAKELFLRGKHDEALESFKCIFVHEATFRDIASIIDDYYGLPKDKWVAKYKAQFSVAGHVRALQFSFTERAKIYLRRRVIFVIRTFFRSFFGGWAFRSRPDDENPGLEGAGRLVPRRPNPPHHLIAARGLPPSDVTYLFPKD